LMFNLTQHAASRTIVACSSISLFSIPLTAAPSPAFDSVAYRYSATDRSLDGRPSSLHPNPGVGDLLNAVVDPRWQLVLLVLHLLPKAVRQTGC
jgi:hypothetical protein